MTKFRNIRLKNHQKRLDQDLCLDNQTLSFYEERAVEYAMSLGDKTNPCLISFLAALHPGARILELGCGGGHESLIMSAAGFDVLPTDGSAAMAALAERRCRRPVRVMKFHELNDVNCFDAVWANACLLHVPRINLSRILNVIRIAMRSGGIFFASYKSGQAEGRDDLGRYNSFIDLRSLRDAYRDSGPWDKLDIQSRAGGGYDRVPRKWLLCTARKH